MTKTGPGSWYVLESDPGSPAFNMALDEALLEAAPQLGRPVLRFYGWNEPAASFGYFQRYSEIARLTLLRPLVRRPTGGGLVPHDSDWTYSLVFPNTHEWYSVAATESYRRMHEWIQAAFGALKISSELAPESRRARPGACFVGYERFDLLWQGRKIAGAAQRRSRAGLLIQGSIQPASSSWPRAAWEQAMRETARAGSFQALDFGTNGAIRERALALAAQKYSQDAYNRKR